MGFFSRKLGPSRGEGTVENAGVPEGFTDPTSGQIKYCERGGGNSRGIFFVGHRIRIRDLPVNAT